MPAKQAKFFLANEKHVTLKGTLDVIPNVLYFSIVVKSVVDKAPDYEFKGKASREHVQNYPREYLAFKKEYPDFKLPWGDDSEFVGKPAQQFGSVEFEEVKPVAKEVLPHASIVEDVEKENKEAAESAKKKKATVV